ncbi:transmembrane protein 207-like [Erpetoichthys calabaricus]|uniref:transmembrane protein 207-like n=1 Tax=Erpetoichthys calabaricus TaxID=27687 RepID=UPI002234D1C2|nr:transmembrane protein 207-like [Erpetoichthys calabaricus]
MSPSVIGGARGLLLTAFLQVVLGDNSCETKQMCTEVGGEQIWYIWFCLALLTLLVLCLVLLCCIRTWLLRQNHLATTRTLTVLALNDSDSIYVSESSQFPHPGSKIHCRPSEVSTVYTGTQDCTPPPSYEEVMKTVKLQIYSH